MFGIVVSPEMELSYLQSFILRPIALGEEQQRGCKT
jgi:hypothetical protein